MPIGDNWQIFTTGSVEAGTVVNTSGTLALASAGDQIFAYQGSPTSGNQTGFITGLHMEGNWQTNPSGSNESAKPTIFTNFENGTGGYPVSLAISPEVDNGKYNCSILTAGTKEQPSTAINTYTANGSNWNVSDSPAGINLSAFCGFSCNVSCVTDPDVPTLSLSSGPYCPGANVTITVTGNLNEALEWTLYTGSCGGSVVATTMGNTFVVSPDVTTTYYVAGTGNCVVTPNCGMVTVTIPGTVADAGPDQLVTSGTSTMLAGNNPGINSGMWTEEEGDGNGVFGNASQFNTTFSGTDGVGYVLRWTISNANCPDNFDEVCIGFSDPSTLVTGDLAFTGYTGETTGDAFSFVLLTDVNAGTTFSFTEQNWSNSTGFAAGDGTLTVTLGKSYLCGSEFHMIDENPPFGDAWAIYDKNGRVAGTIATSINTFALSSAGCAILAYFGNQPTTGNTSGFLTGINMAGGWGTYSDLPGVLNAGNSLAILPEVDNAQYDCSTLTDVGGSLQTDINNPSNWNVNNATPFDLSIFCGLSCCLDPDITSVSVSPDPFCTPGETITLTITGSLGDATEWKLYSGSCGGTEVASSMTNTLTFAAPSATTDYYLRGEGGCVVPGSCTTVTVTRDGAPTISCPGMISDAVLDANCQHTLSDFTGSVIAQDNCDNDLDLTQSPTGGTVLTGVQVVTVTITATDDDSNTASCDYQVSLVDNAPPTAVCQNATVQLDASGNGSISAAAMLDGGSSDNCGGVLTYSPTDYNFSCGNAGSDLAPERDRDRWEWQSGVLYGYGDDGG